MMPLDLYNVYDLQKEHRASLVDTAQKAHLLRLAKLCQADGGQPFLSQMGDLLIAWGYWLKQRYTEAQIAQLRVDNPIPLSSRRFSSANENSILRQRPS